MRQVVWPAGFCQLPSLWESQRIGLKGMYISIFQFRRTSVFRLTSEKSQCNAVSLLCKIFVGNDGRYPYCVRSLLTMTGGILTVYGLCWQ